MTPRITPAMISPAAPPPRPARAQAVRRVDDPDAGVWSRARAAGVPAGIGWPTRMADPSASSNSSSSSEVSRSSSSPETPDAPGDGAPGGCALGVCALGDSISGDGAGRAGAGGGGGGTGGLTATMVPGTSIPVNLAQACDQPAGVSGHHSSGCAWGAPATQIP